MTSFVEDRLHVRVDTPQRMVKDAISHTGHVGFSALERLQKRIEENLILWAERLVKYGQHGKNCLYIQCKGTCKCGFETAYKEAKQLLKECGHESG